MISARKRARGRLEDGAANPVDAYVGNRIRLRRLMLNLSQKKLALMLGITFQQVQKYELGINRIGASRLWDMSVVLQVPVSFFFEGITAEIDKFSPRRLYGVDASLPPETYDPLFDLENMAFMTAFSKLNPQAQQALRSFILAF